MLNEVFLDTLKGVSRFRASDFICFTPTQIIYMCKIADMCRVEFSHFLGGVGDLPHFLQIAKSPLSLQIFSNPRFPTHTMPLRVR